MNFTEWDLGNQSAGRLVEIHLTGTEANVRLMDSPNLQQYKRGNQYRCAGGHFRNSPVHLRITASGQWHVIVDYGGFPGRGTASVSVLG